jgi:hypothetical protein
MWNFQTKKVSPHRDMHPDTELHEAHTLHFDVFHIQYNHVSVSHIACTKWREIMMKNIMKYSLFW